VRDLSNRSTKRQQVAAVTRLVQKAQHAVPGVVLLREGLAGIAEGVGGWHLALSVVEVVTAGAVGMFLLLALWKLAGDIKAKRAPHLHFGIDWADIFLGLMLFTEVASRYPETHKWWRPATLLGMALIFLGFFGGRIAERKLEKARARRERGTASR